MMARPWQAPRPLLAIVVTLVALTYQAGKKTFISIQEVPADANYVKDTLQFVMDKYNEESDDKYNFRIFRILKIQKQQVMCNFSVFAAPWFEKYKIQKKNCISS
uniref:Cystatin 11 n=1 Tax=Propithecus coquereli TaxID=379532 RepID=A0A2K6GK67_PROCO